MAVWVAIGWLQMLIGVVINTERQGDVIRIISARKATQREMSHLPRQKDRKLVSRLVGKLERTGHLVAEAEQPWLNFDPDDPLLAVTTACI